MEPQINSSKLFLRELKQLQEYKIDESKLSKARKIAATKALNFDKTPIYTCREQLQVQVPKGIQRVKKAAKSPKKITIDTSKMFVDSETEPDYPSLAFEREFRPADAEPFDFCYFCK